jgi:hypothetical protein
MRGMLWVLVGTGALFWRPAPASACGGFFCGQTPVDQQAERIVFAVDDTGTTMIVQISYTGRPEDFAWVLPVPEVPDRESLGTFPAAALQALDVNTSPMFMRPPECVETLLDGGGPPDSTPGVSVHISETVGPYEVAVIEAATGGPLFDWLGENGYRLGAAMRPIIDAYAGEGMKLLALRLSPDAGTGDIAPFKLRLPRSPPSIPIRLTSIAAEPEMGFLVFVFADTRYGPTDYWSELEIDPATLRWQSYAWPNETDWLRRVSVEADALGGRAWVTEMAGPTAPIRDTLRATTSATPEQEEARVALLELFTDHAYVTRLYTRISPDEMTIDPMFRPRAAIDVPRERQLSRYHGFLDQCEYRPLDPCLFTACGPGASCRPVMLESAVVSPALPGCACAEGTSGLTTIEPSGDVVATCQVMTSFLTPAEVGVDPCRGFDCGAGTCVPINMTPTCVCDPGRVVIGFVREGVRRTLCVDPALVVGADVIGVPDAPVTVDGGPRPSTDAGPSSTPVPGGGGCSCAASASADASWLFLAVFALRRRRSRVAPPAFVPEAALRIP